MLIENVAAVMDDNITLVSVVFPGEMRTYDFKCTKCVAETLKEGDSAIAETKNGIKIVTVAKVHSEFDIDVNTNIEYKWLFQKVDTDKLAQLKEHNAQLTSKLKQLQRQKTREQALAAIGLSGIESLNFSSKALN